MRVCVCVCVCVCVVVGRVVLVSVLIRAPWAFAYTRVVGLKGVLARARVYVGPRVHNACGVVVY